MAATVKAMYDQAWSYMAAKLHTGWLGDEGSC